MVSVAVVVNTDSSTPALGCETAERVLSDNTVPAMISVRQFEGKTANQPGPTPVNYWDQILTGSLTSHPSQGNLKSWGPSIIQPGECDPPGDT